MKENFQDRFNVTFIKQKAEKKFKSFSFDKNKVT